MNSEIFIPMDTLHYKLYSIIHFVYFMVIKALVSFFLDIYVHICIAGVSVEYVE